MGSHLSKCFGTNVKETFSFVVVSAFSGETRTLYVKEGRIAKSGSAIAQFFATELLQNAGNCGALVAALKKNPRLFRGRETDRNGDLRVYYTGLEIGKFFI